MPDDGASNAIDFLTLVAWWNLYGLPALLVVVTVVVVVLGRRHARSAKVARPVVDGTLAVRRIGLIHYGLALRALILLVQELLTMRTMGIPESFVVLITSTIQAVVNPLLGLGLRGRPPRTRTRRWAIAWYTLSSLFAFIQTYWLGRYSPGVDPARWPDDLLWLGLPVFLLVVMLLPRTGRAFAAKAKPRTNLSEPEPAPAPQGWPWLSLLALLFLVVLSSTVAVEAVDWVCRMAIESGEVP
jgi:hypothetical protein